jgi:hypothetical protein
MTFADAMLEALAGMPDDADVTFTVKVGAAKRALGRGQVGPDHLSTVQAAQVIGGSPRKWREWAEEKLIEGARKDEGGNWRLPNGAAREHFARVLSGEPAQKSQRGGARTAVSPQARGRRGPRKKATLAAVPGGKR